MEYTFSDQVLRRFGFLQERYSFWGAEENYARLNCGGSLVMESDRYSLEFVLEGNGPTVSIKVGRPDQPRLDLAWVFAYLTRSIGNGSAPWLYYAPSYPLKISGDASINWQMERLAEILHPVWPAIFIFLDMDGMHSADFVAYKERADRAAAEQAIDDYRRPLDTLSGRAHLGFAEQSDRAFAYLRVYGFKRVHGDPIFVRYESESEHPVYVNVFHRTHSYQVGVHTGWVLDDPSKELNFDLEELAAWGSHTYHPIVAVKAPEVQTALNQVARHFRRFAAPLLGGDMRLLEGLQSRRIDAAIRVSRAWAERSRG